MLLTVSNRSVCLSAVGS